MTNEVMKKYVDGLGKRFHKMASDLDAEQLVQRPGKLAPILWQVGHIAISEAGIMNSHGHKVNYNSDIAKIFSGGTTGEGPFPDKDEVFKYFDEIQNELIALSQEDLDTPTTGTTKWFANWAEGLLFLIGHRNYHLGKITSLRTLVKKP